MSAFAAVAQGIEHLPPKERVTRSIRVGGTNSMGLFYSTTLGVGILTAKLATAAIKASAASAHHIHA